MKHKIFSNIGSIAFLAFVPMLTSATTPSVGCDSGTYSSSGIYTMEHNGISRTFRLHVPASYTEGVPVPFIAIFHGWGGNENSILNNRVVISEANNRGYILVAPRGLGSGSPDNSYNSWSFSGSIDGLAGDPGAICDAAITPDYTYASCEGIAQNTCSWTHCQVDDVQFVVALVDEVKRELCVDTENVFATGGSNGGMFTWELGQNGESASIFRAIAPLIGLPHKGYLESQGKDEDMPVLVITGTRDKVVPPGAWDDPSYTTTSNGNDRYYYTGATAITQNWAVANGCDISSNATPFNDGYRKADCRTYCGTETPSGWPMVLDCRARMGHTYDLRWSWKLIMDFFDAHSAQ